MLGKAASSFVIDSSVAIKWFVAEQDSDKALDLLQDYRAQRLFLLAPDFIHIELHNIVWKKQTKKGMAASDAQIIVKGLRSLGLIETPAVELVEDAYNLAVTHLLSVYDSLYVALSVREQCPLVTADERLVNTLGKFLPHPLLLANWS